MEEGDLRKGTRWRKRPNVGYSISSAPPQSASMPPAPSASRYSISSASPQSASMPPAPSASRYSFSSAPPQSASMPPAPSAYRYSFSSAPPQSASMPPAPSASRNDQWKSPTFQPAFEESATVKQFGINRDCFHYLFKQLDESLVSRERFLLTKEELIFRRERAVWEWEQFMDSFMTELEEQKREASVYKEKYFSLINQLDGKLSNGTDAFHESDLVANRSQTTKKSVQMNSIFPEMESDVFAQESLNDNGASVKASKKPVRQLNAVLALQASSAYARTSKFRKKGPVKRNLPRDVITGCSGTVDACIPNTGSFSDIDNEIARAYCFKEAPQPHLPEASSTSSKEKEMDVMASNQLPNRSFPSMTICSKSQQSLNIKAENIEYSQTSPSKSQAANVQAVDKMKGENNGSSSANMQVVNMNGKNNGASDRDEVDHVPLEDRVKISISRELSAMDDISNTACLATNA
ncbi:NADPH oxidase activator [Amborella trichopoda]|uniref:NADPH oxidase activator n=1 Tax=Amborella trichopoda TaxID=13333 RepID=UPI0005D30781|nr:NADPH oxidase activator [Amborella trichopoda]|eukprot:XP_011624249.1 NADPH oxidase activator [Amborella trichopoda]